MSDERRPTNDKRRRRRVSPPSPPPHPTPQNQPAHLPALADDSPHRRGEHDEVRRGQLPRCDELAPQEVGHRRRRLVNQVGQRPVDARVRPPPVVHDAVDLDLGVVVVAVVVVVVVVSE